MICIALHEILPYLGAFEFVQGNTVHVHACTVHTYMLVHVNTCMHVPYIASYESPLAFKFIQGNTAHTYLHVSTCRYMYMYACTVLPHMKAFPYLGAFSTYIHTYMLLPRMKAPLK